MVGKKNRGHLGHWEVLQQITPNSIVEIFLKPAGSGLLLKLRIDDVVAAAASAGCIGLSTVAAAGLVRRFVNMLAQSV
jgi:hypothetical protein